MKEAVETGERLSKELILAKNDSDKNKEESRGIRKRLAGCHTHYKQLQEQYDILLKEKDNVERQLVVSQKNETLRRSQVDSWQSIMKDLREKRHDADNKVNTLSKENDKLQIEMKKLLLLQKEKEVVVNEVAEEEEEEDDDDDDEDDDVAAKVVSV
jgi:chromosome segregation ATPase